MLFGHLGAGLALKPAASKLPWWGLLIACEALDLLCFGFSAAGIESLGNSQTDLSHGVTALSLAHIPWSHGLFMALVWAVIAFAVGMLIFRERISGLVIGAAVFSHWVLDFIVHVGDMPLFFEGSPLLGLGLWGTGTGFLAAAVLEFTLFAGGIIIYLTWTKRNRAKPSQPHVPAKAA